MTNKLLSFGYRFSRDCFLCLGGALVLIAVGDAAGNLPDIIRYHDWPASEVTNLYVTASLYAISGAIFLCAAYGLFKKKRWGVPLALAVNALTLTLIVIAVLSEPYERADFAISLSFYAVPLSFTLWWELAEMARTTRERRLTVTAGGQGHQIP
jgi:hypothetical protein